MDVSADASESGAKQSWADGRGNRSKDGADNARISFGAAHSCISLGR